MSFNKTIQMCIFDGNPNGRIMCELSNWNGRVYKVSRNDLNEFANRSDSEFTGVCFLFGKDEDNNDFVYEYVEKMRLEDKEKYLPTKKTSDYISLEEIIERDSNLKYIYDSDSFILRIDDKDYHLFPQITKKFRDIIYITPNSKIEIMMKKKLIIEMCDFPENNSLYIMLLSGNLVTYGDENRTKQRHIATHQIYKGVLDNCTNNLEYYIYDIKNMIMQYKNEYSIDKPNNIFFTTAALRDYHYLKQKNNAYYHIQAINLPFQNIEFYYIDKELKK